MPCAHARTGQSSRLAEPFTGGDSGCQWRYPTAKSGRPAGATFVTAGVVAIGIRQGRIQNQEAGASLPPPLTPGGMGSGCERVSTLRRLAADRAPQVELRYQNR